ncbi:PAS domain-containing sensor histidine kinase [Geobacter pickeringii]|uniref:histidine kinase n=1 Tax=Geobacter pickeringii TaxID=345632 RepID=A0A0B5BGB7_9BACT|nr:PAS domain S-box protein [Geobacter pickeringii]AJE03091.1 histidine kinase [Geobacter pickeringii]
MTPRELHEIEAHQAELEKTIEELRRSRQELEESRNKYALLYDFAPVGYFTFDRDGAIQSVNLFGGTLLGMERSLLINRRFEEFVADRDRFLFSKYLEKVFTGKGKETCRLLLATGRDEPQYVRIEAMGTESGAECLAVVMDITERRRAEQALSESEYNLSKAQSMTHVGSWSFNPDTAEVKGSAELLRIMRLRTEETTQESFAGVVHPEDLESVMEHLRLGIEHGRNYEIEHRLLFRDGTLRWVYTIVEPLVDSAGKVLMLYGTTQDITERKQVEVDLRNKTNELQAIFDSITDGITVYDHDGRIQHHNPMGPRLFPREIQSGKSCSELFHPETATLTHECPVERAIRGERAETSHVSVREGNKTQYVDITATTIKDALGEKNRALVFFRDVSKKRLQEMHLIQSEKMSSIGVLATGIAHEINNPLTSVAGYAEALLRRFRDEPALERDSRLDVFPRYLEVIVRESYRCKGIINHLLSFGRKSDGIAVMADMNAILLEILELLRHQPDYRRIDVVTTLKEDLPRVLGDPSGLRQVCMNLLVNAHQAIAGAGRVAVTTEIAGDTAISITIRDTGPGIAPDMLDRIWDPFFTTKEVGKGVGLGLALTFDIIKRHGGEIHAESRLGEGSLFTVILPACDR